MKNLDTMSTHCCVQAKLRTLSHVRENIKLFFIAGDQFVLSVKSRACNVFDRIPCLEVLV